MPIINSVAEADLVKWKFYQAFAFSDGNFLENLLQNPVAMQIFLIEYVNNSPIINSLATNLTAINTIINSQTAMNAVINSQTAMNAIANSQTAMNAIANSQTAMNAVINSQTAMNAVINSQTAMNAIYSSSYRNTFINSTALTSKSIPTMTSNTAPEGVASASSIYSSFYDAYKAMDKNTETYWCAGGVCPQWLAYQFAVPVFVHTVTIAGCGASGNNYNPNNITIQCSADGNNWINVQNYQQEFTSTQTTLIIPFKAGYYKYWRVYINSTVSNSYYPIIKELNFTGFIQPS